MPDLILSKPASLVRIAVMQGQARVSAGPRVEFSTVLGSCVATCLFDPEVETGGLNHFLLPEPPSGNAARIDEHYGVHLMELLINEMLENGAAKSRMRAHLYGGANMNPGIAPIGTMNAEFACRFLEREGIPLVRQDLGGNAARRVEFRPASGQVRCRHVANSMAPATTPTRRPAAAAGEVELF